MASLCELQFAPLMGLVIFLELVENWVLRLRKLGIFDSRKINSLMKSRITLLEFVRGDQLEFGHQIDAIIVPEVGIGTVITYINVHKLNVVMVGVVENSAGLYWG